MTRHIALAGLLALFAAGCSESTGPAVEVEHGVLFLSTRDGATDQLGRPLRDIYRMNADGTGVENLTRQPSQYLHLSLSPDGRRVAFASDRSGCDIWSMNTDGTGLAPLTNQNAGDGDGCNLWPRWSPDGSRFAFVSNREMRSIGATGGLYDVYVMDADGGNAQNVSQLLGEDLLFEVAVVGWSPAGRVVFETSGTADGTFVRRVYTVNADGTDPQPLFDRAGDHSPAWSPDGSQIAFISERDGGRRLYVMNADGTGERALTAHAGEDRLPGVTGTEAGFEYSPWSPNGSRIAFQVELGFESGVYVIEANGSGQRRLTMRPGTFNGWSPDGDRIAYTETVNTAGGSRMDVFVVNVDGTDRVNLTDSPHDDSDAILLPR